MKDTNLGSTPFQCELLAMLLNPSWLFGEGIQDVVDKVLAQKSVQTYLSASAFSFIPKKGPFRKSGQSHTFGSKPQATNSQNRKQPRVDSCNFKSGKPFMSKSKNQFRNRSGSDCGNSQQSGDRFKSPLQTVLQPFRA